MIPSPIDFARYDAYYQKKAESVSKYFSLIYSIDNLENLIIKTRLSMVYIDFIREAKQILEEIFPGNCDIHFVFKPEYRLHTNTYGSNHVREFNVFERFIISHIQLVILFPRFTITNSNRQTLEITDLVVKAPIELKTPYSENLNLEFKRIRGGRLSVDGLQHSRGYAHSHLESVDYTSREVFNFPKFCTGSGDINSCVSLLNSEYDPDMLKLYLLQIIPFVEWESIEGLPYFSIDQVNNISTDIGNFNVNSGIDNIMGNINEMDIVPDLDWTFDRSTSRYVIVDNEKFEDFLIQVANPIHLEYYKNDAGEYFTKTRNRSISRPRVTSYWIPFRGEKRFLTVLPYTETEIQLKAYVHPQLKNHVKKLFENRANTHKIREIAIGLYS